MFDSKFQIGVIALTAVLLGACGGGAPESAAPEAPVLPIGEAIESAPVTAVTLPAVIPAEVEDVPALRAISQALEGIDLALAEQYIESGEVEVAIEMMNDVVGLVEELVALEDITDREKDICRKQLQSVLDMADLVRREVGVLDPDLTQAIEQTLLNCDGVLQTLAE